MRTVVDHADSVEHTQRAEECRMRRVTGNLDHQLLIGTRKAGEPFV